MSSTPTMVLVGGLIKKGFIAEERAAAARADGELPSQVLATYYGNSPGETHRQPVGCRILAPLAEYEDLAYNLPDFEDLPIFYLDWQNRGKPTTFIVTCIDDKDEIFIDTQGYDYARYRGPVLGTSEMSIDNHA